MIKKNKFNIDTDFAASYYLQIKEKAEKLRTNFHDPANIYLFKVNYC